MNTNSDALRQIYQALGGRPYVPSNPEENVDILRKIAEAIESGGGGSGYTVEETVIVPEQTVTVEPPETEGDFPMGLITLAPGASAPNIGDPIIGELDGTPFQGTVNDALGMKLVAIGDSSGLIFGFGDSGVNALLSAPGEHTISASVITVEPTDEFKMAVTESSLPVVIELRSNDPTNDPFGPGMTANIDDWNSVFKAFDDGKRIIGRFLGGENWEPLIDFVFTERTYKTNSEMDNLAASIPFGNQVIHVRTVISTSDENAAYTSTKYTMTTSS